MRDNNDEKGLVPRLRFPEYRNAGPWEVKRLGEVAAIHKGKGLSKADISSNGVLPCIRYGELYTHYAETIDDVISHTNVALDNLVLSHANDVIIPASGETTEDIATVSCVLRAGVALGGDLNIIRSPLDGSFLSYYLNGVKRYDIARVAQGNSVVHLYPTQLATLKIGIPRTPEQRKIADCLSSLDEVIELQTQKLEALNAHKKGLMQQLFPAEGETTPRLRFPEFRNARPWEVKRLGKVGPVSMCKRVLKKQTSETGDIPFYKIGTFGKKPDAYISKKLYEEYKETYPFPSKGDILISASGTIGRIVVYDGEPAYFQDSNIVWIANDESIVLNTFLQHCYKRIKWQTDDNTISRLYNDNLRRMKIVVPSIPEQQKIADCLSSLDELIELQAQKLDALKAHKTGLMQQLFPSEVT